MATEKLGIVIDATVKGKREVEGLNKELEGVGKTAPRAGASLGDLAKGAAAAGIAFYAIKEAAGFAMQKIGEGAELEAARGRFDNLAESIGVTGDALMGTLRQATQGMVSDAELVASATDIISLGLAGTEADVARLATVISTLGLDMQQVIMTFANNSTMRLDALGLSVEDVTNKAKELEAQGFVGDAFDEAVLIALEEKMTLLGDAVETTSGKIAIIKAGFQDMGNAAKSALAQGVEPLINGLANQFMAQDVLKGLYDDGTISGMQYVRMLGMMTTNATGARMVSNEINKILAEQNTQTTRGKQATEEYAIALDDLANAGRDAQNAQNTQIAITEKASEATHEHVYSLEELARMGRGAVPEALKNIADAAKAEEDAMRAAEQAARDHVGALIDGFNDSAGPIQDYLQAQQDIEDAQGEWVQVTITNASALSDINSQLASDLSNEQRDAYRDILNTVEEGSAEWLGAYKALQGDLTATQRAELIAQRADLDAQGDTVASVYTGNAQAAEEATAAMKEAHQELINSYKEVAFEAALASAEMSGDPENLRNALDFAVAIGEISQEQADLRFEAALTRIGLAELGEEVGAGEISAAKAGASFDLMARGMANATSEANKLLTEFANLRKAADELDGRSVNINVNVTRTGELPSGLGGGGGDKPNDKVGSDSPKETRASGGPVFAGNAYLVGEQGPEVVVMGSNGTVIPNNSLGGNTINITVTAGGMNGRRIGQQIATEVTNALGRLN
jgi:hypothetical protein